MKKTLSLLGVTICGAMLVTGGLTANAAEVNSPDTNGTIGFKQSTDSKGNTIKPETDDKITPESGGYTEGNLRLQHVPSFNFGVQEIAVGAQTFNPTLETYKYKAAEKPTETQAMPHFIQVTDVRGNNQGWNLTVHATIFKNGAEDELTFAKMTLNQAKLSNTTHDATEIAKRINVFASKPDLVIPTGAASPVEVMSTKTNDETSTTNGTQTSIVLNKDYDKDKVDYAATDKNLGVKFDKTNADVAVLSETDPYVSVITWSLVDGI